MVPLKLFLRNFMCYRDNVPPLDLEGIHVACLTGNNGHGKSALLDAMTWALWGEARAKDDELIHLGQSEMEVELEFKGGDHRYRAIRKRARPRPGHPGHPGHTILELHASDEGGKFYPITGNTVRETQRKINSILHMDYDTFINSVFLIQGRADEFTTKPPGERKKVLADVLGISQYDRFEETARERARDKQNDAQSLQNELGRIDQELAHKDEYQWELEHTKAEAERFEVESNVLQAYLNNLQETKKELDIKRQQSEEARMRVAQAEGELNDLEGQREERQIVVAKYQASVAQREEIETGFGELEELRGAERRMGNALSQLLALTQEKNRLERNIEADRGELASQVRVLGAELERLEKKASPSNRGRLEGEWKEAEVKLKELAQEELALNETRRRIQELSAKIQLLQSANVGLMDEMKDLRAKVDLLVVSSAEARCPVCGSVLDPEGRQRLATQYERDGMARKEVYLANEKSIREKAGEYQALQREMAHGEETWRRDLAARQSRIAALERELGEVKEAESSIRELKPRIDGLETRLKAGDFALEDRPTLREINLHIEALGYDQDQHERLRHELAQKEVYDALSRDLEEAVRLLPRELEALARLERATGRWRSLLEEETARHEALSRDLEALPELAQKLSAAQGSLSELQVRQGQARMALGAAQQKLENCRQLESIKGERTIAFKKAQDEKGIYDELTLAFGKRGIQAMIIEDALPELAEEANGLLGRITDHRMAVKLETQRMRATGKGDPIETLDIKISDELGTRNYELYSGGEAFRVNFALRIALSKMLAKRASAPLPTLIIDEGFGTQDSAGREKLVEAINSIQDDFERILVITHLDELKEAFPVRIEVTKTLEGSTFAVT